MRAPPKAAQQQQQQLLQEPGYADTNDIVFATLARGRIAFADWSKKQPKDLPAGEGSTGMALDFLEALEGTVLGSPGSLPSGSGSASGSASGSGAAQHLHLAQHLPSGSASASAAAGEKEKKDVIEEPQWTVVEE